jgi:hypothetical protein
MASEQASPSVSAGANEPDQEEAVELRPLLRNMDEYGRAANDLSVGQVCRRSADGDGAGRDECGVVLYKGRGIEMKLFQSIEGL